MNGNSVGIDKRRLQLSSTTAMCWQLWCVLEYVMGVRIPWNPLLPKPTPFVPTSFYGWFQQHYTHYIHVHVIYWDQRVILYHSCKNCQMSANWVIFNDNEQKVKFFCSVCVVTLVKATTVTSSTNWCISRVLPVTSIYYCATHICIARTCCRKMAVRLSHAGIVSKRLNPMI